MALDLSLKIRPDVAGEVIWIQDITGAYDVDSNEGGWGDPNPELQESCLAVYAERVQDGDNHVVELIGSQFIYDNAAANNKITEWQLVYDQDGQFNVTLFMFQVSTDGENYVEGGAIDEGEYVFYNNALWIMEDASLVAVSDLSELVGSDVITHETCEELMTANARILYNTKYKSYREKRRENCEDLDPYREELTDIHHDIIGAHYAFKTNLKTQARETVDKIHKDYA